LDRAFVPILFLSLSSKYCASLIFYLFFNYLSFFIIVFWVSLIWFDRDFVKMSDSVVKKTDRIRSASPLIHPWGERRLII